MIRDGVEHSVGPSELVLGDVVLVRRGDQLLADGVLVGEGRIEVDESLLTGESEPVSKAAGDPVLSGSACVAGTATYEVRAVGQESFANRLATEARRFRDERTPLQTEAGRVIGVIAVIVIVFAIPLTLVIERRDPDPTAIDALLTSRCSSRSYRWASWSPSRFPTCSQLFGWRAAGSSSSGSTRSSL